MDNAAADVGGRWPSKRVRTEIPFAGGLIVGFPARRRRWWVMTNVDQETRRLSHCIDGFRDRGSLPKSSEQANHPSLVNIRTGRHACFDRIVLDTRPSGDSDSDAGEITYDVAPGCALPGVRIQGYRTFRDTCFVGSFEGDTQVGLGTRARLPFRVLQVDGHLIVDVAHTW